MEEYCRFYGVPRAIYADRHSVFYNSAALKTPTSFAQALRDLGGFYIASVAAPGRGRVERVHRTLQSRLVPQLASWAQLKGKKSISRDDAIAVANVFLPRGFAATNAWFPKPPREAKDAHPVPKRSVFLPRCPLGHQQ